MFKVPTAQEAALLRAIGMRVRAGRHAKFGTGAGSKRAACAAVGMMPQQLQKLERGTLRFTVLTMRRLCRAFSIDPRKLLADPSPAEQDDDEARNN